MNLQEIRNMLHTINDDSTIIVTTNTINNNDFELAQIYIHTYKLYISKEVEDISRLFLHNWRIKKIIFEDWDSSNIKKMNETFYGLELDNFPDFSILDLRNLTETNKSFYSVKIKGNIYFKNHSLKQLEYASSMFNNVICNDLIVDLGDTEIKDMSGMFGNVKAKYLKVTINKTDLFNCEMFLSNSIIGNIDLSDFNISKCIDLNDFLGLDYMSLKILQTDEIIMPNTIPYINVKIKVSNNIDRIHCKKEWLKYFEE